MNSVRFIAGMSLTAALLTALPEASAVDVPIVEGLGCGLDAAEDAVSGPGIYTGSITGGPVYGGSMGRPVTSVYLLCTVQTGANDRHADPDAATVTSWSWGTTSMPPTPVWYGASDDEPAFVCTEVWVDTNKGHVTLFLNSETMQFSLDPQGTCEQLIDVNAGELCSDLDLVDCAIGGSDGDANAHHLSPVVIVQNEAISRHV